MTGRSTHGRTTRRGPDWRDDAACLEVDPELFFPTSYGPPGAVQIGQAKAVCHGCPVRSACLEDAMAAEGDAGRAVRTGIRGGLTPGQRRQLYEDRQARARGEEPEPKTGRPPAVCGTRSAYQRHVKKREPIDDACRQANREASNRLRQTGTTRVLAS